MDSQPVALFSDPRSHGPQRLEGGLPMSHGEACSPCRDMGVYTPILQRDTAGLPDTDLLRATERYLAARSHGFEGAAEDALAWEWFYTTYGPAVRRIVHRARLSPADSDDCVQEAWTELLGAMSSFAYDPKRGRFEAWLSILVRRKIIQFYRRRGRELARPGSDAVELTVSMADDPAARCQRREDRAMVRRVLATLRPEISDINYRLLQLRWVQGREIPDVAEILAITPDQVRYRLHRLKRRIQRLLSGQRGKQVLVA